MAKLKSIPSNHSLLTTAMLHLLRFTSCAKTQPGDLNNPFRPLPDGLRPLRRWLNAIQIRNVALAHLICRVVPVQCPFARDINLFGLISVHIPPLCKLNPLYEEVMGLRFKALCYLADECSYDVRRYC